MPMPTNKDELNKRPEAKNLIGIYSSLTGLTLEKSISEFSEKNFSQFKEKLSQVLVEKISPISKEIKKLLIITSVFIGRGITVKLLRNYA